MAKSKEDFENFLRVYNEVDHYMRTQVKDSSHTEHVYLIEQLSRSSAIIARHAQDLRVFAQLRNVLVHNPFMRIANPIALPAKTVVQHYEHIKEALINPPSAMSIAIPFSKLFTCTPDTRVSDVIGAMNDHTYTHVPVLIDGVMCGVFSENTLLAYLAQNKDVIITNDMKMSEFSDLTGMHAHSSEHFEFIRRSAPLADVYEVFNTAIKLRRRIGAIFITEHGLASEKVLGLITAWDLALPELSSVVS